MAFNLIKISIVLLFITDIIPLQTSTAQAEPTIEVQYVSQDTQNLTNLLAGAVGEGWLLYQHSDESPERPVVVVHLHKPALDEPTRADLYQPSVGETRFELPSLESLQALPGRETAAVEMLGLDGWWVKDGLVSYNLEVRLNGPMIGIWGMQGMARYIEPGQPVVKIQVRDTDRDGIPDWDLRQLIPEFPGMGFLRVNYSERKCATPLVREGGVFPPWPFIALEGGYEQPAGVLRPPVLVDWDEGKITAFSELVTARNQNCSYTIYSIEPLASGLVAQPDFEAPFAFYDLSGQGTGHPNLILRTERYPQDDPWLWETDEAFEHIRYSWREAIGDWLWDYKVEVLGFHPYTSRTPIADGQYLIDAPNYQEFPTWVMDKPWPLVTFIDTEGRSYKSSEGIYEWSPRAFSVPYFTGQVGAPDLTEFQSLRPGLRGEYRVGESAPVSLYFSPLDGRLHLLGAQSGLVQLGEDRQLREVNLDGDALLDGWIRGATHVAEIEEAQAIFTPEESLYILGGRLLYSGSRQVRLLETSLPQSSFEILPPVDHASWAAFRGRMAPLQDQRKDPTNLASWLDELVDPLFAIQGAQARRVRADGAGYRFELELEPGFSLTGADPLGLKGLPAGAYAVTLDGGRLAIAPLVPPRVSLELAVQAFPGDAPALRVRLANAGTADLLGVKLQIFQACPEADPKSLHETRQTLLAGETAEVLIGLPAAIPSACSLQAQAAGADGQVLAAKIFDSRQLHQTDQPELQVLAISSAAGRRLPSFLLLLLAAGLAGLTSMAIYRRWA